MVRCAVRFLFVACVHLNTVTFIFVSEVENWTFLQEGISSLLSQDEDLKCFTRMLDDLTCFWDNSEETNFTYKFFYSTEERIQKQCHAVSYRVPGNARRHVCAIPVEDIVLFQPLIIEVIESSSNESRISQLVSIESVVLLDPPSNVSVHLNGNPRELRIGWVPPKNPDINEFLIYEISYWKDKSSPASAKSVTVSVKEYHDLRDLRAGIRYMVRLRTKPDGISFDGFWSAWSETVSAVTPYSSDEISLRCSSPDLQFITCQWKVNKTEESTRYSLYYQTRQEVWKICSNQRNTTRGDGITYQCTIATSEANKTVVIINASYPHHIQTFYKKPFKTENIVRPDPPRIVKTDISTTGGKLRLFWEPPIIKFQNQMVYQIRYSEENGTGWKTLHIQKPLHSEVLDLPHGKTYYMQLRAKPNGLIYRGYWSSWSDTFTATIPGSIEVSKKADEAKALDFSKAFDKVPHGKLVQKVKLLGNQDEVVIGLAGEVRAGPTVVSLVVGVALLLTIALFVSRLIFPNTYSNMKKRLWPQIPNLERLLEGYLIDFQKHSQPLQPTCDKPVDNEPLPSILEIISEGIGNDGKKCAEEQEAVCQKHPSNASSTSKPQEEETSDETKGSSNGMQNYIFLDLQYSSSLPQEDTNFHKKDKSNLVHDSQSQRWLPGPDTKAHKGHIQSDISGNKQLTSLQPVNVGGLKQHHPAPLVSYDEVLQLFAHLHFPVPFDYRSMSATDISNHTYLLLSDLEPNIFSQQCSLLKE